MQNVSWVKCQGDVWCKLNAVNLDHAHFDKLEGVYLIWHGGKVPAVVYVGQGIIRDRIRSHRVDSKIQRYLSMDLFVTWARVERAISDGLEVYLANRWGPKVGIKHPPAVPIEVNSPW